MKKLIITTYILFYCFAACTSEAADSGAETKKSTLPAARQEWLEAKQAYREGIAAYNNGNFVKALDLFNIAVSKDQSNFKYVEARFNTNLALRKDSDAARDWETYMHLVNKNRTNIIRASMPTTPEAQLSE